MRIYAYFCIRDGKIITARDEYVRLIGAERFVKLADQFHLPIVHLVDNPGFMIGGEAERTGTIRYGVQAMNAIYRASVPLASVVVRRAYGIAGSAMSKS